MSDPEFRLLVVCTANRCRSPLAEAIARDRFATRRWRRSAAISSGTRAEDGLPATEGTELTAERLGLDVNAHSSRALTDDVIGCVYVDPDHSGTADVMVRSWVRASHAGLDDRLAATVDRWLRTSWPVDSVRWPGRTITR